MEIAEKTRQLIRILKIPHKGSSIDKFVTISAGVCTLIPVINQSPSILFEKADKQLYLAKHKNRNCVMCD